VLDGVGVGGETPSPRGRRLGLQFGDECPIAGPAAGSRDDVGMDGVLCVGDARATPRAGNDGRGNRVVVRHDLRASISVRVEWAT